MTIKTGTFAVGDFLKIILVVQLATFVSVLFNIPFLRQVLGFIYLSFIPGFILLRVLRINTVSLVENVLFSVGLSIASLMFIGLLLNTLGPVMMFPKPLSPFPVIASVITIILVLCVFANRVDKGFSKSIKTSFSFSPIIPFLVCIPFATIIGAEVVNIVGDSSLLLILVIVTCAVLLCSLSSKIVSRETFPLIILVISLFLLFHMSFSSNFLVGWDIHNEYYFANLTSVNGLWDRTIPHPYDGMLSVTILPIIYMDFLNLDLNWVFKLVYPLVFSLVPLTLYSAYRKKTGSTIALLSVFFFMAMDTFYVQMLGLAREMIAELFFALLILVILEERISLGKKRLLFIAFSIALTVSHYSLSYIFMIFLLLTIALSPFLKRTGVKQPRVVSNKLALFYFVIVSSWSLYVSPSLAQGAASVGARIYDSFLELSIGGGMSSVLPSYTSPLHDLSKYLFLGMQFFVLLGVFGEIIKYRKMRFGPEYFSMSIWSTFLLVLSIFIPSLASSLNMSRLYHIALFFLAPFCISGVMTLFSIPTGIRSRLFNSTNRLVGKTRNLGIFLISIFLVLYLLFQVGFIYQISGDIPISTSLSRDHMEKWSPSSQQLYIDEGEFASATWLSKYANHQSKVYTDLSNSQVNSYGSISPNRTDVYDFYPEALNKSAGSSYIYLGRLNTIYGTILGANRLLNTTDFSPVLNSRDKIYSNGDSDVYCGQSP